MMFPFLVARLHDRPPARARKDGTDRDVVHVPDGHGPWSCIHFVQIYTIRIVLYKRRVVPRTGRRSPVTRDQSGVGRRKVCNTSRRYWMPGTRSLRGPKRLPGQFLRPLSSSGPMGPDRTKEFSRPLPCGKPLKSRLQDGVRGLGVKGARLKQQAEVHGGIQQLRNDLGVEILAHRPLAYGSLNQ